MQNSKKNIKRRNIYFRQTPKEFRSAKQAAIYEHINANLPYRIFAYTKGKIVSAATTIHGHIKRFSGNLPKDAKKV